jgi:hypothetical protein
VVVDRRRAPLIEAGLPNQPCEHDTFDLDPVRAQELVKPGARIGHPVR